MKFAFKWTWNLESIFNIALTHVFICEKYNINFM